MSFLPCSLCLSYSPYCGSSSSRQGILIVLEGLLGSYLHRNLVSVHYVANCCPGFPTQPCLIPDVMSPDQVGVCFDSLGFHNSIPKLTTVTLTVLVAAYQLAFTAGVIRYLLSRIQQFSRQYFQPCSS